MTSFAGPTFLDDALKVIQSLFYITLAVIGVLTFIKARNGLLNTVNTEYHKKVIERLYSLSEDLYEEFDHYSPRHWVKDGSTSEFVRRINEQIIGQKDKIMGFKHEHLPIGVPVTEDSIRIGNIARKYKSDPFLPERVRKQVVSFLEGREQALLESYMAAAEYYFVGLRQGRYWDSLDENEGWLHNKIMDGLNKRGFGISENEERVHEIRAEIQRYFEHFNPLRDKKEKYWSLWRRR